MYCELCDQLIPPGARAVAETEGFITDEGGFENDNTCDWMYVRHLDCPEEELPSNMFEQLAERLDPREVQHGD